MVGICGFDLVGEDAELVALGFAEICLIGFLKEEEEIEDVILGEMEVDDTRASAFSMATESHSDFAESMTPDKKVTSLRISEEFLLKRPVVFVTGAIGHLASEIRGFDESERHGN